MADTFTAYGPLDLSIIDQDIGGEDLVVVDDGAVDNEYPRVLAGHRLIVPTSPLLANN